MITYILMAGAVALLCGFTGGMPGPMTRVVSQEPSEPADATSEATLRDLREAVSAACAEDARLGHERLFHGQTPGSEPVR